jgi:hypothetical protein
MHDDSGGLGVPNQFLTAEGGDVEVQRGCGVSDDQAGMKFRGCLTHDPSLAMRPAHV